MSVIVAKIRKHVGSNGFCCCVPVKDNIGECSRGSLPGVLDNSYLGTTITSRWSQSFSFECKEVRNRKSCGRIVCPFCVHVVFDRVTSGHVVKIYWFFHLGYVVNFLYIVSHVKFEADLCTEERNQLVNFGKIGYTGLQSKNGVSRLFSNRIYDLEMIYYVVGNTRNLLH